MEKRGKRRRLLVFIHKNEPKHLKCLPNVIIPQSGYIPPGSAGYQIYPMFILMLAAVLFILLFMSVCMISDVDR